MNPPRLAWPLAISLALHLGLGWLLSPGSIAYLPRGTKAVTLTVLLAQKERSEPLPAATDRAAAAPTELAPVSAAAPEASGTITQKARFLVAPDLSSLEHIPVPVSGSLTLRLEVSALGTVDGVTVIKSDPVPKVLLDGALERFRQARLTPAREGSKAVASTLDLVIRYEAAPVMEWRDPVPGSGTAAPARQEANTSGQKRDEP